MVDQARLEYLEGRVDERARGWDRVFSRFDALDRKVDNRMDVLESRIDRLEQKFDTRIDAVDQKFDRKVDDLRTELSKQFRWTIGLTVTLVTGLLAAILTR